MNSHVNTIASQVQAMTIQVNHEVGPRVPQHDTTMSSCLRDFSRMNDPIIFHSKVGDDPQDIMNGVYKILYSMGVTSI